MRATCEDCARKHLSQANIESGELPAYDGDEDDDHWWDMVGHMAEAEDQLRKKHPIIADAIRKDRKALEVHDEDPQRSYEILREVDFNGYIVEITEIVKTQIQDEREALTEP